MWFLKDNIFRESSLDTYGLLRHGTSSRFYGDAKDLHNREQICAAVGVARKQLVSASQVHGTNIVLVTENTGDRVFEQTDGFMTNVFRIPLSIMTADCQPVFFFDREHHAIGLAHAGWRGTAAGILPKMVEALQKAFGTHAGSLVVAIGPYIKSCCYTVGKDVADRFSGHVKSKAANSYSLDLAEVAMHQLRLSGVNPQAVHVSSLCTGHDPHCFSYRRDPVHYGRMLSLLEIDDENEPR